VGKHDILATQSSVIQSSVFKQFADTSSHYWFWTSSLLAFWLQWGL